MFEKRKSHKLILDKANHAQLGDTPVSKFMNENCIHLSPDFTVKGTIEIFRVQHISGAPIVDFQHKVIGVISEYDLLIQAASKDMSEQIDYRKEVISVYPETTLKEVLVILYKKKLKWLPVINKENFLLGVISRIDVLSFIALQSPNAL